MIWPSIIGQERVKRHLAEVLRSGRLPHAYLFSGSDGVGKDAMALELGRVLHCERQGMEACEECRSCVQLRSLQHPDVKLVCALPRHKDEQSDTPPLAKLSEQDINTIRDQLKLKGKNPYHRIAIPRANVIKINSIREVRRDSALSTFERRRRLVIISRAEEMGAEASNALLKTLEEPSGHTMLILTTSQPESLLPTIRSRCQTVRFDQLTAEEIEDALVRKNLAEKSRAELVSRLALGSFSRALELLGEDIAAERQDALAFVMNSLGSNFPRLMDQVEELSKSKDRDVLTRFLSLLLIWFRDALVLREGQKIISFDQKDELMRFTTKFPHANLAHVITEIERAIFLLQRNVYIVFVLLQLSIQLKRSILPEYQTSGRQLNVMESKA